MLITILVLLKCPYFYKSFSGLSLSRMLVEFSLNLVYCARCRKNFQIYVVYIPRKCIESRHFYSCQPSHSKLSPRFLSSYPRQREITHSPGSVVFHKSVSSNKRKGWMKLWFSLSKLNQEIWRWLITLGYSCFVWFVILPNVMALQFCK